VANQVADSVLAAFALTGLIPDVRMTGRDLDLAIDRYLEERL
jgi:hypothetical protein